MVKVAVQIQASHVGIGKSTFTNKLKYPKIDDCIKMIESDLDLFSTCDDKLRAYLVLENSAASMDEVASHCDSDWTIVSSRSALISCFQFSKSCLDTQALEQYHQNRLKHLGVDYVHILDFGDAIQKDPVALRNAYQRMIQRGRPFEQKYYNSWEKYNKFFDEAERKKSDIVQVISKSPFYVYSPMSFHDFNEIDEKMVVDLIESTKKKFTTKS